MSYQALYRVWRPQELTDVIGQEHITKTLKNALVQEKLSHAYLFTGPRGTGKTSAAKIVAKAINCERAPVAEPCNECRTCLGIQDGSIVDVIEIDAASNNGVDEIRDIRDKVKFAPSGAQYKVYIIDEVHMLTTGAFNALLKTLEEPPRHVIFILATTEPHKVPLTIISRCQRFDFKRISAHTMIERMERIIAESGVSVEKDALSFIARASEGGMRDALSLLDQAISHADETVKAADVMSIVGAASQDMMYRTVQAVYEQNVAAGLAAIDEVMQDGKDPGRFLDDLIYMFRDLLLVQSAPDLDQAGDRLMGDETFKEFAEKIEQPWIFLMLEKLNHFQQEMKWATHPHVFLEMFIVQASQLPSDKEQSVAAEADLDNDPTVQALKQQVRQLEKELKQLQQPLSRNGAAPVANGKSSPAERTEAPSGNDAPPQTAKPVSSSSNSRAHIQRVKDLLSEATKAHLQTLHEGWSHVFEQVKRQSVPASAWLNDCKPVACSEDKFVLSFKNEMHRDMVDGKFRDMIEETVQTVLERPMTMYTLLNTHWEEVKEAYLKEQNRQPAEGNGTSSTQAEAAAEDNPEEPPSAPSPAEDPLVNEAVKLVGHELIDVKE
ncbi:DNA polymerase III subunit gamma/tau [Salisediminibacterium halotolerans]|uniref:DNA-directed DNA polymerase n=1 Tax=Salisediminibacterium halotolerans TaxID=517425 RepID=A0A1H9WCB2_9BACI|nr:DNA polymerase III subunit gamma/tau [Salisediminibacterium haloalkalitolerans]SES31429.1 DNA polymerase-3 subunit gamma/tau [Salisediminibacterium haloalkalitolerans]